MDDLMTTNRAPSMITRRESSQTSTPSHPIWQWNGDVVHASVRSVRGQWVLKLAWNVAFVEQIAVALVVLLLFQSVLVQVTASVLIAIHLTRRSTPPADPT